MDEVNTNWKRLWFKDDGMNHDGKYDISVMEEWEVIKERFLKANYKINIKEKINKIASLKTTNMKPHVKPVKTKGVSKKTRPTLNDNSIKQSPSLFKHLVSF